MSSNSQAAAMSQVAIQSPRQATKDQVEASAAGLQSRHRPVAVVSPRWIWRVVQWKYTIDARSKWLKKVYFHYVFLNFNRFSYWVFDLLPPNGRDDTGRLCWTEDQGCQNTEWEAEQEAMKYPFGHAVRVPLYASLPADTINTEQFHPNSPPEVRSIYERKTESLTIPVQKLDLIRLAAQNERADQIIQAVKLPVI